MFELLLGVFLLPGIFAPPVVDKPTETPKPEDVKLGLDYEHYLKEVISHLENDDAFRKQLENANASEIQDGSIAQHLQFVSHNIRSKLDEVKRKELERLRDLALAQDQLHQQQGMKNPRAFKMPQHIDLRDHQFTEEDLKKLILQTTKDLEQADVEREKEFKNYEMEKEHMKRERIRKAKTDEEREQLRKEFEELKKKHNEHEKFNHPGSKKQLEEVWEDTDKMDGVDFNPRTFFNMHDLNGDNHLDQAEVEALFQKELDKAYADGNTEDDMMERYEEMNRMREHVFKEFDKDNDRYISLDEFLNASKQPEFDAPKEEYKPIEEQEFFDEDEFKQFEEMNYPPDEDDYARDTPPPHVAVDAPHEAVAQAAHQAAQEGQQPDAQMDKPVHQQVNQPEVVVDHQPQTGQHIPDAQPGQHIPDAQPVHQGDPPQAQPQVQNVEPQLHEQPVVKEQHPNAV